LPEKDGEIHSHILTSGKVAYIVNNKFYLFPENIPVNKVIPSVYITGLWINGKAYHNFFPESENVSDLKKADLNFKQNTLKFEFAALNYTHPELNKYRYFMKGIDRDTVSAGPGTSPEYKQMRPGHYKFWVSGSNNDNIWNRSGASMEIRIHPPWYRSTLSYLVYLIALVSTIALFIRIRTYNLQKEKMRLEGVVKARTEELEMKNRQLAEIDRAKTHFFTDISHEIRTPLSLILGPLETIGGEEKLSRKLRGMVELMKRNAQRLMQLVNQLLDISRLDSGKMIIKLANDDIVKFLKILLSQFLSIAESKQINYMVDLPQKEFLSMFDKDKTEKIITNILSNAFRYTPKNGTIQCVVKIKETGSEQQLLEIKIADTGPGISEENIDRIFDRFYRVEGSNETEGTGTGIGLSLSHELTTLLHGRIKVNSEPGKGSEFLITLPLGNKHLSPDEYIIEQAIPAEKPAPGFRDYTPGLSRIKKSHAAADFNKVLVIEDNQDLRNFIKESLASDYKVLGAENGRTGINLAFTMMPDVIITDIMMPDISGITLCSRLKNDERTSHIPIVMLTARTTVDDKLEGLRSGADDYIFKPFLMDELKTRIANLLLMREKLRLKYLDMSVKGIAKERAVSVDDRFMEKVVRIINENISNFEFDVTSLNKSLGMSRMHIFRKIKILTGLSPHFLIRNIRLEKAADLILHKSGNVTEIANSVGISNTSGFTKAFREHFGVTPKKFSKQ
jgi:signal transduction histidine kinase/DNA-binding response OmpR family regulator